MSLKTLIQREVQKALSIGGPLQDIPIRVQYYPASGVVEFDPSTQQTSSENAPKSVDVVFVDFSMNEIDGVNVFPEDKLAYMSELNRVKEGIPSDPVIDDKLVESGGASWKVVGVTTDPAKASHSLHVRKP